LMIGQPIGRIHLALTSGSVVDPDRGVAFQHGGHFLGKMAHHVDEFAPTVRIAQAAVAAGYSSTHHA
jgi:hypothetical protein